MKRDEIRVQVAGFSEIAPQTKEVQAFRATFTLHRASYREIQESRAGGMKAGEFDVTQHLLALVVLTAKDEDGEAVFDKQDLEMLLSLDGAEMDRLVREVLDLNGLTEKAHDEGKETSPATTAGGAS